MTRRIGFVSILVLIIAARSYPQTPGSVYQARATLAQSRTAGGLKKAHEQVRSHDKLTELIFFSRWLALSPRSTVAARGLLQNIPATEKEAVDLMTLSDPPEEGADDAVMLALGKVHDEWPTLAAQAVILVPAGMQNYVSYLPLATTDVHSNFTGNAQSVCSKLPKEFRLALNSLSQKDRDYVRTKVFDADHCRALFVSEAE